MKVPSINQCLYLSAIYISLILALACSSDEMVDEAVIPASEDAPTESPSGPISVTDALGQTLIFESIPEKIASISPTATEILYAAGGSSILRDRASRFPEEVQALPDVGSAYEPSLEAVVAAQPDLVIIEAITQARFAPRLVQSGLKVMAVKAESSEDVVNHITLVGRVIGKNDVAAQRVTEIEGRLNDIRNSDGRSVLMLISDQDRNLYAAKPESYTGLIAATLGMVNKAEGLEDSGPYPGFSLMSPEAILVANPDVIVTITPAPEPAPRLSSTITQIRPFAALSAIQTGSIYEADVTLFLQAPGPRIVEAVEALKQGLEFKDS